MHRLVVDATPTTKGKTKSARRVPLAIYHQDVVPTKAPARHRRRRRRRRRPPEREPRVSTEVAPALLWDLAPAVDRVWGIRARNRGAQMAARLPPPRGALGGPGGGWAWRSLRSSPRCWLAARAHRRQQLPPSIPWRGIAPTRGAVHWPRRPPSPGECPWRRVGSTPTPRWRSPTRWRPAGTGRR